jgi:hypothetical protein
LSCSHLHTVFEPQFQAHVKPAHSACCADFGWCASRPPPGLAVNVADYSWLRPCSWLGSLTSVSLAAPSRWSLSPSPALHCVTQHTTHLIRLGAHFHV